MKKNIYNRIIDFMFSASDLDRFWVIGVLILRVYAGTMIMLAHGLHKLQWMLEGNPILITAIGDLGFPFPTLVTWLIVMIQVGLSLFVVIGFWTRPSALISGFIIAFGVFSWKDGYNEMEAGLLFSVVFAILAITGPGKISIDRMIRRKNN